MVLVGDFIGDVSSVALEVVGKDVKYPVLKLNFVIHKGLKGATWQDTPPVNVNKMFFLTTKIKDQGANAGKTDIDVLRENLNKAFGYTGRLSEAELTEGLVGKSARLVCAAKSTPRGDVTEVKWVNHVDGSGGFKREPIPAATLAALDKMFSGSAPKEVAAADAWGQVPA